jgi:hypothetical protein
VGSRRARSPTGCSVRRSQPGIASTGFLRPTSTACRSRALDLGSSAIRARTRWSSAGGSLDRGRPVIMRYFNRNARYAAGLGEVVTYFELSSRVTNAYHALAIDEKRGPFKPTLWTRSKQPPNQTLEQVWFAGCHRDAGGGEPNPGLADITLAWMVGRAKQCGLAFEPHHFVNATESDPLERYEGITVRPDPDGQIHESRRGLWKLVWRHRRHLPAGGNQSGCALSQQSLRSAAEIRATAGFSGYPPATLRTYLADDPPRTDV